MTEVNQTNVPNKCSPFLVFNTVKKGNQNINMTENKTPVLIATRNDKLTVFKSTNDNKMYCVLRPEDLQLTLPSEVTNVRQPGRPRKTKNSKEDTEPMSDENEDDAVPRKVFRTRSGRVTKPPRYIDQDTIRNDEKNKSESINNPVENQTPKMNEDNSILIPEINKVVNKPKRNIVRSTEHKRNISSQYRCGTCKKAYLGQNKMLKHLKLNPSHDAPEFKVLNKNDIWTDFMNKVQLVSKDQQARYICEEFTTFLQKAQSVIPKLLKPVSDSDSKSDFTVNETFSNAINIPKGNYTFLEDSVLDIIVNTKEKNKKSKESSNIEPKNLATSTVTNENQNNNATDNRDQFNESVPNTVVENCAQIQNNDQNSLLNLLDTGQVTFDSSNSEEVMNMDQLINERLKSLTDGEIETNTTSQNLNLDLSLDMFSYHSN